LEQVCENRPWAYACAQTCLADHHRQVGSLKAYIHMFERERERERERREKREERERACHH